MANVPAEKGYTPLSNILLEVIYRTNFTTAELKIILFMLRYTSGYNRTEYEFSLSFISGGIGISKRFVSQCLKTLIYDNVLHVVKEYSDTHSRIIKINMNYRQWNNRKMVCREEKSKLIPGIRDSSVVDEAGLRTPDEVGFYTPDEAEFHTPDEAGFHTPDEVGFHTPDEAEFHTPDEAEFHTPDEIEFHTPDEVEFHTPDEAEFHTSDEVGFHTPDEVEFHTPDEAEFHTSDEAGFHTPDEAGFHTPDEAEFHTPDEVEFHTPDEPQFHQINKNINKNNKKKYIKKKIDHQQIIDLYNGICLSLPKVMKLSDARKKAISARLNTYSLDELRKVFTMAEESDFLSGRSTANSWCSFDWLMKDSNIVKVLEGNYSNKGSVKSGEYVRDNGFGHVKTAREYMDEYRAKVEARGEVYEPPVIDGPFK